MRKATMYPDCLAALFVAVCVMIPSVSYSKQHEVASGEAIVVNVSLESQDGEIPAEIPMYIVSGSTNIRIILSSAPKPPYMVRIFLNNEQYQSAQGVVPAADGSLDLVCLVQTEKLKPGKNTLFVNVIATNGQIGRGKVRVKLHDKTSHDRR